MLFGSGANRLAQFRVTINLQFIKDAVSLRRNKMGQTSIFTYARHFGAQNQEEHLRPHSLPLALLLAIIISPAIYETCSLCLALY